MSLSVFNGYATTPNVSVTEERELIALAQNGCNTSYETLMAKYAPLLKKYARSAPHTIEKDEIESALLLGFVEAVQDFDLEEHSILSITLPNHLKRALSEVGVVSASFTIPQRSLSRWLSIHRKAEGNIYAAMALAPTYSMSTETFMSIYTALRETNSLEAVLVGDAYVVKSLHINTETPTGESDQDLANLIFDVRGDDQDLTDREAVILRYAYGWMEYGRPLNDSELAEKFDMSRATAQRVRTTALAKARKRLGVGE